jgi:hypothetical protein
MKAPKIIIKIFSEIKAKSRKIRFEPTPSMNLYHWTTEGTVFT